ncbi:hypothetical protein PB1_02585 [Bacillus methanolicus PB1]|uniref:Uncharacterized protein n=1 Tax=Bacillus methanolicus PB1 TaxID=997296 RepID=I3E5L9_BACMT|nr:hypothetical protein [Bacillus methanolicus]EIJ81790.1 hypothetical protein PB1_02585 [Bacillus methanolicus PB1]
MSKFIFEHDLFVHGICFRYTIIQFEEDGKQRYAAGVGVVFVDEGFQMLQGDILDDINDAKLYLQQLYFSKFEIEKETLFLCELTRM